jgi:ribosomal protein L32
MSRSRKDQRGGHRQRRTNTYSCGCCDVRILRHHSTNRTERERESLRYETHAHQRATNRK